MIDMDAQSLRALQSPLKERYRADPASALVTLRASGRLAEGVACEVEAWRGSATAGLHPATGGDGSLACSGDMLLQALVACAGVTLRAVGTSLEIPLAGAAISAEGELDFRGTLGVSKDAPVGFRGIHLRFRIDSAADDEKIATLLKLTERYCVVAQKLRASNEVTVSRER